MPLGPTGAQLLTVIDKDTGGVVRGQAVIPKVQPAGDGHVKR
jgi:hypothetical protein